MSNVEAFLHKSFQSLGGSIIIPLIEMGYHLLQCAKANSYIETLGEHADTLHCWIKDSYEEDFRKAFEGEITKALKHLPTGVARLAFDITAEPFYGKTRSLYIINTKGEPYQGEFHFLNMHLIVRKRQIPLMALPILVGEGSAKKTIELLEYAQAHFTRISFAVFDRGFYIAQLIDYLEAKRIHYLIFVPEKKGSIQEYVQQTETFGKFRHQLNYQMKKSTWKPKTTIVVCKGIDEFPWIFATNINFRTRVEYVWYYKRRWQIETNFRIEDEAKIKSKSTHHLIRYFYHLVGLLLHLLWIVHKNVAYYVPFKKYLHIAEQLLLLEYLEIRGA